MVQQIDVAAGGYDRRRSSQAPPPLDPKPRRQPVIERTADLADDFIGGVSRVARQPATSQEVIMAHMTSTITPIFVADLHAEGELMPVYVHVIDDPKAARRSTPA